MDCYRHHHREVDVEVDDSWFRCVCACRVKGYLVGEESVCGVHVTPLYVNVRGTRTVDILK